MNLYTKTAPNITAVTGDNIKSYGVEIDTINKLVFIPVVPGTDISTISPTFICETEASAVLTSGSYENGIITVTDAIDSSLTQEWRVFCEERGNAVIDGFYADPNITCFNGKYYLYVTTDGGSGWDAPYFKCFSSDDLVNWKDEGIILDLADVSWSNGHNGWAPTVAEKDGKYYFYYSAAPINNGPKNLAVAVSDSPTGPFTDMGIIKQGGELKGQMIDPAVFIDDDGQAYLYWGNGALYGAKLSDDMLSIDEATLTTITPPNFREASFMIKRNGTYYMMWSEDDTGSPDYHVRYGKMTSPLSSISGNTIVLHRDNANSDLIKGTGHHSVINIPGTDEWYICYHRFNTALYGHQETQCSAAGNHREVCINKMEFDENGNIISVVPTLSGITTPVYVTKKIKADTSLEALAKELEIDSEIYGNQYMPSEYNGVKITWTSDNPAIASDGTVTRGDTDTEIKVSALFDNGAYTYEKTYTVTVLATPANKGEEDMGAYLFVHFVGTEDDASNEQIYFSVSKDGQTWKTLNNNTPILTSTLGELGVRDPHIVRSPEGDKFFLIATDLSIYNRRDDSKRWNTCQTCGSKSIMIWESTDLVNWSEQRMVEVADQNAGCAWAPESVYDYEKKQYMVFWASKVSDDNYSTQRIYRSYTTDFIHFSNPEIYISDKACNIDTTFIIHDGVYYRFTKDESKSSVTMMKSTSLNGDFEEVSTYTINGTAGNTITGYEGPTAYKINGEEKWCLLLDYYSKSQGYKPFITNDIATGQFTSASDFNFDAKYRHGTVMPITLDEYNALTAAYAKF